MAFTLVRNALLVLALTASWAVADAPVRIMPLGDSITEGNDEHPSYRVPLWRMLRDAGYHVDFVGNSGRGLFSWFGDDRDMDPDHEGHWAWQADEVLARLPDWAARVTPDVALVHLGSNDILRGERPAGVVAEMRAIVRVLREVNPRVTVLVAQIIPASGAEGRMKEYNDGLRELAGLSTAESRVIVVDLFTGFDPATDTYDGLHPNTVGERKMAEGWLRALKDVLPSP